MTRVKGGPRGHRKHVKILSLARGFRGTRATHFKRATEAVLRAGKHAFEGRKMRRRDIRSLWIVRINAALSKLNLKYSKFMGMLAKTDIELDRKTLAEMAVNDFAGFTKVVETVTSSSAK